MIALQVIYNTVNFRVKIQPGRASLLRLIQVVLHIDDGNKNHGDASTTTEVVRSHPKQVPAKFFFSSIPPQVTAGFLDPTQNYFLVDPAKKEVFNCAPKESH